MPMLPRSRAMCSSAWNTSRTRPLSLRRCSLSPSLVMMPAASWPRCCSMVNESYNSWLTGVCETRPAMPHMASEPFLGGFGGVRRGFRVAGPLLRQDRAEAVGQPLERRDQHGLFPPGILARRRQAHHPDQHDADQHAANQAEAAADGAVDAGQPGLLHQGADHG